MPPRRYLLVLRTAALLSLVCFSVPVNAQQPKPTKSATSPPPAAVPAPPRPIVPAIQTPDTVYLPGTPEMISAARPSLILPHPQRRYALIVREEQSPPPGPLTGRPTTGGASLILWDGLAHRARIVWEQPSVQGTLFGRVASVDWLPNSNTAVAEVMTVGVDQATGKIGPETHSLLALDPLRDARARVVYSQGSEFSVDVLPTLPMARLMLWGEDTHTAPHIRILNARGQLSEPINLPPKSILGRWSDDGNTIYYNLPERIPPTNEGEKPRIEPHFFVLDLKTGQSRPLTEKPKDWSRKADLPNPPALALKLTTRPVPVPGADGKPSGETLHPLFLQPAAEADNSGEVLLAPNADKAFLLNDLSAALYVSQQAVYVVPIYPMRRDQFETMKRAAQKASAMSRAKQIGLGILMYAQDYNEHYPPGGDVANTIEPYLKNNSLFNDPSTGKPGFTYLMNGQGMAGIAQPATTKMGYLTGPGGRAVIYADGHVRWEDGTP